jgi:hypothetical protein
MLMLLYLLLSIFCSVVAATTAITTTIYVAPPVHLKIEERGTKDFPFRSLEAARDLLRTGYKKNTKRIIKISGTHYLSETFILDERDSGSVEHPIIYQGIDGENSTLFGGVQIPSSSFKPVFGKPNIYVAPLFTSTKNVINTTTLGTLANPYPKAKMELFYGNDNQPMTLARDPNIGSDKLKTWKWVGYENMTGVLPNTTNQFNFTDTDTGTKWMNSLSMDASRNETASMWLHGYFKFDWRDTFVRVSSIKQSSSTSFTVTTDAATPPQYPYLKGCRFYAVNSLGLLDSPGEYYISKKTGDLFFMPPTTDSKSGVTERVVVSVLDQVISLKNVENVHFESLTISTSQNVVAQVSNSNNINITNSTVSNAGGECISMNAANNSHIHNNVIYGCGGSGASIASGSISQLTSGRSSVVNNVISNFSRIRRTYQPAVGFSSVGLYVGYNNISRCPHTGIQGGGNNNLFEYNRIDHCAYESVDVGAFYIGRSWSQRGNVARFNTFSNIRSKFFFVCFYILLGRGMFLLLFFLVV